MNTEPNPSLLTPVSTPTASPPAVPEAERKKHTHRGNGHISNLPVPLRDQVGLMVLDGIPYAEIIASLGKPGEHLVPNHITAWKNGTFKAWQQDFERRQAMADRHQLAQDLVGRTDGTAIPEAGLRVAAAQLNEFLLAFDPAAFAGALAEKPELYLRLINTISRVNDSTALGLRTRTQQAILKEKNQTSLGGKSKNIVTDEALAQISHQINLM